METAIIGGGIGGLTTALYLAHAGHNIHIYEQKDQLGGRIRQVEHDGYSIDQGPTIVLLPDMILSILEENGISRDEFEMIRIDPLYKLIYPDGQTFTKWSHLTKQLEEIKRCFPGEEQSFLSYLNEMYTHFMRGKQSFLDHHFVDAKSFWTIKNMFTLYKMKSYQSVRQTANRFFTHPRLQEAFSFQTLYIGGHPEQSPALYSLIPYSEYAHGIWYFKGGYSTLVKVIERHLRRNNVSIHTGVQVDEIVVNQKTCKGIKIKDSFIESDRVIFNGDFPTMDKLLHRQSEEGGRKQYEPSSACLLLYMGLDREYEGTEIHQFFMPHHLSKHLEDIFQEHRLPKDPAFYTFYPSKMDKSLAPPGKSVLYVLIPVPANIRSIEWDNIEPYVNQLIEQIEQRGFPNLKQAITWLKVRTPKEAQDDGLYQGGSFGIAPTLRQSGVFRPQIKPYNINGLYAVGASVHPGGGVPIVMQGAKLLANLIKEETVHATRSIPSLRTHHSASL
jgi:phytoene desaturase